MKPNTQSVKCQQNLAIMILPINFINCLCGQHFLKKQIQTGETLYQGNLIGYRFRNGIKSEPQ